MADASSTKSPGRDVGILILFFIVLGVAWLVRGGPERVSKNPPTSPFLSTTGFSYSGNSGSSQAGASVSGNNNSYYPAPIPVQFLYEELGIDENFMGEQADSDISEYQGKITLSSGQARWTDPAGEYVEVRASSGNSSQIDITNWTIEGKIGLDLKIPQAVRLYLSNQVNRKEDILLSPGDKAIITTGHSPIGDSFLLNKCSGYFSQFQNFSPSISLQCPRPQDEDWPLSLSDDCLDYIDRLPACKANFTHPLYTENNCIEAINKTLNYNKCVDLHKGDDDFYKKEWRIYLSRDEELWKDRRENIILRDSKGKIVDEVSYK